MNKNVICIFLLFVVQSQHAMLNRFGKSAKTFELLCDNRLKLWRIYGPSAKQFPIKPEIVEKNQFHEFASVRRLMDGGERLIKSAPFSAESPEVKNLLVSPRDIEAWHCGYNVNIVFFQYPKSSHNGGVY